jgi:hypothetical protein
MLVTLVWHQETPTLGCDLASPTCTKHAARLCYTEVTARAQKRAQTVEWFEAPGAR